MNFKHLSVAVVAGLGSVAAFAQSAPAIPLPTINWQALADSVSTTVSNSLDAFMPVVGAIVAISVAYGLFRRFVG